MWWQLFTYELFKSFFESFIKKLKAYILKNQKRGGSDVVFTHCNMNLFKSF